MRELETELATLQAAADELAESPQPVGDSPDVFAGIIVDASEPDAPDYL